MLQAIERYMKQAIVDKVPSVSSSALVSSLVRHNTQIWLCAEINGFFFLTFFVTYIMFVDLCSTWWRWAMTLWSVGWMKLKKLLPVIISWCRWVKETPNTSLLKIFLEGKLTQFSFSRVPSPLQYHALGLLYHLRKNDRLAVTKMLNKFTKSGLKSPFAYCMLIRIASKLLDETEGGWVNLGLWANIDNPH